MPLDDAVQAANHPFSGHGPTDWQSLRSRRSTADYTESMLLTSNMRQASVPLTACRDTTFLARSRHWVGQIIFFNVSLQQFCLQVHRSLGLFSPPVHVSKRLHLANHRCAHSAIPRPPFVKTGVAHPVARGTVPIQPTGLVTF